ncbi:MAG: hypothetical protein JRN12_02530 [Nitrososphaerota archaeon]|jgi:hypothetical protein|nr:hypothetical protein [Nitrososphaerota archaeon]MDG6942990.1 hypothetical protein [Nitrososphaerota archaeon]MDG6950719.1 hypothetical protein [Nitrososphaerota archaeon]
MGRTIPSFRIAEVQEASEWKTFRRTLPKEDMKAFDDLLLSARLYISASSAAVRPSRFEGMAMAIVFHHYRLLERLIKINRAGHQTGRDEETTFSDEVVAGLDSWHHSTDALSGEDRARFIHTIHTCPEYFPATQTRRPAFLDEVFIMRFLLAQHKAIIWLTKLAESRAREDAWLDT